MVTLQQEGLQNYSKLIQDLDKMQETGKAARDAQEKLAKLKEELNKQLETETNNVQEKEAKPSKSGRPKQ